MNKRYLYASTVSSRRQLKDVHNISPVEREAYSSLFYYNHAMEEYYLKENTVSGYNDETFGTYFVLDIDNTNIEELTIRMERFFNYLKDKKCYTFFSGNKGYHIYIPKEYVEYPPELENNWTLCNKLFAKKVKLVYPEIANAIDLSIYDKVRLFRLPFSIHPKSGRRKQLIKWIGLNKENPLSSFISPLFKKANILEEILDGKAFPNITQTFMTITTTDIPNEKHEQIMKSAITKKYVDYPFGEKLCIYKILNTYDLTGMRHKVALRLQSYWKEKGYSKEFVWAMLNTWSERLTEPLDEQELKNIIKFYEKGYVFTCNDDIKSHFCVRSCHLYKSKDIAKEYIYEGDDYLTRYTTEMYANKEHYINMSEAYADWDLAAIKPGYVVVLAGGPGSGKTTFMLNLMNKVRHINWLFLSIEMTGIDITEKYLKITEIDWKNKKSIETFKEEMKNIITIDKPNIDVREISNYANLIKSKTGRMPDAIVIDYLSLMISKGHNQTERAISISKQLKKIAKELKVIIFVLSQVPKDLAGDGNIPLGLDSPKDSGEVVNMADMLWTCWRPNRNRPQVDDNIFRVGIPKNRHGSAGYYTDFEFIGHKYQINNIIHKEDK